MTTDSSFVPSFFLSESENFQDKSYEDFRLTFNDVYEELAKNINRKDLGYYMPSEMACGQRWYSDPQDYQTVYRKRVDLYQAGVTTTPGLNNFTSTNPQTVPHGITITANTVITRLYGVATDPSTLFIPLPYLDMTGGGNHIQLSMDGTNIILRSNYDYSGFTASYVIVEFVQG